MWKSIYLNIFFSLSTITYVSGLFCYSTPFGSPASEVQSILKNCDDLIAEKPIFQFLQTSCYKIEVLGKNQSIINIGKGCMPIDGCQAMITILNKTGLPGSDLENLDLTTKVDCYECSESRCNTGFVPTVNSFKVITSFWLLLYLYSRIFN